MPKKLLLIRHAKSDWDTPALNDFDRPLNSRGVKNAPPMALRLFAKGIVPTAIVSSPALRAITTAGIFAETWQIPRDKIRLEQKIYEASSATLLKVVNALSDDSDFTALFGHNPGLSSLVHELCDSPLYNIPTCGAVLIDFPFGSWKMVSRETGRLLLFDYPKKQEE